jgi:nucleoside-diphosphate-sugar epimerase
VAVAGTSDPLGARVLAILRADPALGPVIDLDADLEAVEALAALGPADTLIHLGDPGDRLSPDGLPELDPARLRKELDAASGLGHLVVLSSAMAYGAWPTNPVPLTEETPLRPDPGYAPAAARAEVERLVGEWRLDHPDGTAAVLRPSVTVSAESMAWLAVSPWSARALRAGGSERPSQFLHHDDLASAVDHARTQRLDGPFNVAPDGWLSGDALAELAGPVGRLHLPSGWVARARDLRARMGVGGVTAGEGYTSEPWVVANDRLRATGWEPRHRNDEVYVEADPGGPLATVSPRRRQEISLAVAGLSLVGLVGGVVALVRRRRRL